MGDTALPDEIISEILSPALKVPDEAFSNISSATFASYTESSSAYLVVCKSWLRVATPLLYNVVILRSKAQAKALSNALSNASKKHQDLGRFIRKLRVEGGYGAAMHVILKLSPNVIDLFLSLDIWSPDTTDGLCKGLKLISPTRLILRDVQHRGPNNKMVVSLANALVEAIPKWNNLTAFSSPVDYKSQRAIQIVKALGEANRLETISVPRMHAAEWVYTLLSSCPLRLVEVRSSQFGAPSSPPDPKLVSLIKHCEPDPPQLKSSPETVGTPGPEIQPSLNPFFVPMEHQPAEVQEAIWSRVLYFAMSCPERAINVAAQGTSNWTKCGPRIPFLLVSKTFLKLGLVHFYAHIALQWTAVHALKLVLQVEQPRPIQTIVSSNEIPISLFIALGRRAGHCLVDFRVPISLQQSKSETSEFWSHFTALKTLRWSARVLFSTDGLDRDALPLLEELMIINADTTFYALIARMRLASLRRLQFSPYFHLNHDAEPLLKAHGAKLVKLFISAQLLHALDGTLFAHCPNLESLTIAPNSDRDPPGHNTFSPQHPAAALTQIVFSIDHWPWQRARSSQLAARWDEFFTKFNPTPSLPTLREIRFTCCQWPTNERDIAKSCWVRWAELLFKFNVDLTDKEGKKWRPRLKVGRQ